MTKRMIALALSLVAGFSTSNAFAGPGDGGGGDSTEMGVAAIRADLLKWIGSDGPTQMQMPVYLKRASYVTAMTSVLQPGAVVVSFVTTSQENATQNPEQKVSVGGAAKSCRGFTSGVDKRLHILCNSDRYPTGGADQYRLIHHEFAGLAGVERNNGAASDYSLSEQITDFLVPETILRLAVKKVNAIPHGPLFTAGPYTPVPEAINESGQVEAFSGDVVDRIDSHSSQVTVCRSLGAVEASATRLHGVALESGFDQNFAKYRAAIDRIVRLTVVANTFCGGAANGEDWTNGVQIKNKIIVRNVSEVRKLMVQLSSISYSLFNSLQDDAKN